MKRLMPLRRVVVDITNEAPSGDPQEIRRAIKSWHNRLSNGSIPRTVITKLGRELFLDIDAWENWLNQRGKRATGPGRPRNEE